MLIGITALALAQSAEGESLRDRLQRMPPDYSWEVAMHASFSQITYWREDVPYWIGHGVRGAWGKHWGNTRLGTQVTFSVEGPVPINYTLALEPTLSVDHIKKWFLVGGSLGPALLLHSSATTIAGADISYGIAPSAALRLGWSQPWSRVGRRVFVMAEPKVRYFMDKGLNPGVALVVGAGRGR